LFSNNYEIAVIKTANHPHVGKRSGSGELSGDYYTLHSVTK
jgi:hypothetical protein